METHGQDVDVIIDATDNFETRQLINDFAYKHRIPWIYGGVVQSTYTEAAFIPGKTPCFNCLVPQLPALNLTCDTVRGHSTCRDDGNKFTIKEMR